MEDVQSSTEKRKHISSCSSGAIEFYKTNTSLDYFHPTEKNRLTFERDFFIFNYDEYEKYMCHVTTKCRDSFYESIGKMVFYINEVKKIRLIDIDIKNVSDDPIGYMLKLLKNAINIVSHDDVAQRNIKAYELKIQGFKNDETYRILNNIDKKELTRWKDNKSQVSNYLNKVEPILNKLGIPFIDWKDLKNLSAEKNKENKARQQKKIADEMIRQIKNFNLEKD